MKFRINLFNETLLPPQVRFSLIHLIQIAAGILGVGIICLVLGSWIISRQENQLKQLELTKTQLFNKQKNLEQQLAENKADPRLVTQVNLAKSRLKLKQLMLGELDRRSSINSQGFSPLLTDLGRVSNPNLWLDRIQVKDKSLIFEGYSLDAQAVPLWVESLKDTQTLKGFSFAAMTMNRGEKKPLAFLLTSLPLDDAKPQSGSQQ